MWKVKCRMKSAKRVIGPNVKPCDSSYYKVYCKLRVAGAVVNCVMQMWNVAFCARYFNPLFVVDSVTAYLLRNEIQIKITAVLDVVL